MNNIKKMDDIKKPIRTYENKSYKDLLDCKVICKYFHCLNNRFSFYVLESKNKLLLTSF